MKNIKSSSGLSIAALITGIFRMSVIPIILGSLDLYRIKKGLASIKGKGMDIAGIVLGALGLVFVIRFSIVIAKMGWAWFWA